MTTALRTKLSTIVLVAAVLTAAGAPVFAAQLHPVCAAKQHDCGTTAKISKCCCDDQGSATNQSGPAEAKVQVAAHFSTFTGQFMTTLPTDARWSLAHAHASPPRARALDLPTLFASLLI